MSNEELKELWEIDVKNSENPGQYWEFKGLSDLDENYITLDGIEPIWACNLLYRRKPNAPVWPTKNKDEEDMALIEDTMNKKFPHYYKDVTHLDFIDVYRVLDLFEVKNPAIQHAIKKLLVAGGRGSKGKIEDMNEAIASIKRAIDMLNEDS